MRNIFFYLAVLNLLTGFAENYLVIFSLFDISPEPTTRCSQSAVFTILTDNFRLIKISPAIHLSWL